MNIIQMREKIMSYLDVTSVRFQFSEYEDNIMTAENQIINDRIDNIKKLKQQKTYSFQSIQRIRDELYTLVVSNTAIVPTGSLIPIGSYPADLRFVLGVKPVINGTRYIADSLSYNEEREVEMNPYKKPQLIEPYRVYYIESGTGLTILFGSSGTFTNSYIDYIKSPVRVNMGTRHTSSTIFTIGNVLIATEPTVYNSVTYDPGETITIVAGFLSITSGEVVFGYTNSDLPEVLHEEICKITAGLMGKTIEAYQKGMIIEGEANK